jgi:hypothetical protein
VRGAVRRAGPRGRAAGGRPPSAAGGREARSGCAGDVARTQFFFLAAVLRGTSSSHARATHEVKLPIASFSSIAALISLLPSLAPRRKWCGAPGSAREASRACTAIAGAASRTDLTLLPLNHSLIPLSHQDDTPIAWSRLTHVGSAPTKRSGHTLTSIGGGKAVLFGGASTRGDARGREMSHIWTCGVGYGAVGSRLAPASQFGAIPPRESRSRRLPALTHCLPSPALALSSPACRY